MMPNPIPVDHAALYDALSAAGWTAEYEPANPDDENPARYTYGRTGGGRYHHGDPVLVLHYGTMLLLEHPTLDLSVHGVSGTIASVDLVTTPAAEVPVKVAQFARRHLIDLVAYASSALRWVATLPEAIVPTAPPVRDAVCPFTGLPEHVMQGALATARTGDVFADIEPTDDPDSGPLDVPALLAHPERPRIEDGIVVVGEHRLSPHGGVTAEAVAEVLGLLQDLDRERRGEDGDDLDGGEAK